ncbi:type IV secretory pathway VirB3-like protein [Bacillus chungangensis]|uniref:Type IV secretory pathway VirB3-like protein n=1 Tax=Bacillus chungangensis TaxID=587633 RepID=A0ABT9WRI4_9BACI|nr:hypothetical protein [Bacillus chungangensis]MDQ0175901.1 type IV secretory pathway VirB3-like protein [Bacillus chungangensis]
MPTRQFLGITLSILVINLDNSDSVFVALIVFVALTVSIVLTVFAALIVFVAADVEAALVAVAVNDRFLIKLCVFKEKRLHLHELLQGPFSI